MVSIEKTPYMEYNIYKHIWGYKGMAKSKYKRIQARVSNELKDIFDMFLSKENLNMGQTEFFERYLPSLLMAIDENLYLKLYKQVYEMKNIDLKNRKVDTQ